MNTNNLQYHALILMLTIPEGGDLAKFTFPLLGALGVMHDSESTSRADFIDDMHTTVERKLEQYIDLYPFAGNINSMKRYRAAKIKPWLTWRDIDSRPLTSIYSEEVICDTAFSKPGYVVHGYYWYSGVLDLVSSGVVSDDGCIHCGCSGYSGPFSDTASLDALSSVAIANTQDEILNDPRMSKMQTFTGLVDVAYAFMRVNGMTRQDVVDVSAYLEHGYRCFTMSREPQTLSR